MRHTQMLRQIDEIHTAQQLLKDEIARKVHLIELIFVHPSCNVFSSQVLENEELQLAIEHAQAGHGIATPGRNESMSESHARPFHRSTSVRIVTYEGFALLC